VRELSRNLGGDSTLGTYLLASASSFAGHRLQQLVEEVALRRLQAHLFGAARLFREPLVRHREPQVVGDMPADGGQELDPRTYAPTPVGTTILFASGGWSRGAFVVDPSLGIDDIEADLSFGTVGAAYVFDLAGRQARVLGVLPYAWGDVSGEVGGTPERQELRGLADPRFRLTVGLLGAPALTLEELRLAPPRTALTANLTVAPPWGDYDTDQLVNLGNHRWAIKPELGMYQPAGRFTLEGYAGAWLFTANHDYYPGSATKRQDPLLALRGHVGYAMTRRVWLSLDATWFSGRQTDVEGVASPDRQENVRMGGTLSLPLGGRQSLKLTYSSGTNTRRGSDYDTFTGGVATRAFAPVRANGDLTNSSTG
jgi:hypothetical protein